MVMTYAKWSSRMQSERRGTGVSSPSYYDPTATTVQIRGEWFFSSPADTSTSSSQGLLPSQWQPGDFPIAYPNQGPAPNWPVAQMTLDKATGVWSYTTPLPSGTFTYGFYVNCTSPPPGLAGCTELSDPSNPPWDTSGSVEADSEVYVPSDPRWLQPAPARPVPDVHPQPRWRRERGRLDHSGRRELDPGQPDSGEEDPAHGRGHDRLQQPGHVLAVRRQLLCQGRPGLRDPVRLCSLQRVA